MKWRKPKMNWKPKCNHTPDIDGNFTETIYDVRRRELKFKNFIDHVKPIFVGEKKNKKVKETGEKE